jgi:hypothetical protein
MKARLIYYQKVFFHGRYLMEMSIHEIGKSERYPDGVKYGLLALDRKSGKRVLMDNHHPKGHHVHIDRRELPYDYVSDERLIDDFKRLILEHLGVAI